jgi:hypothetical protein
VENASDHAGVKGRVLGLARGTNSLVIFGGALVGLIAALVVLLQSGPSPSREASVPEARARANVLLEQFQAENVAYQQPLRPRAVGAAHDAVLSTSAGAERTMATLEAPEQAELEAKRQAEQKEKEASQLPEKSEREGRREGAQTEQKAHEEQESSEASPSNGHVGTQTGAVSAREAAKLAYEDAHPAASAPAEVTPPPLRRKGAAEVAIGTNVPTSAVDAVLRKAEPALIAAGVNVPATCGQSCPLRLTVDKAISDYSSNLNDAAQEVAAAFHRSRTLVYENKREPVGAVVDYSIDLAGYAGHTLILEWTLNSTSGGPLPREWWRNVIVKYIKPTTADRTAIPGSFWAPVPPAVGNYYFRLRVFDGHSEAAHGETNTFH